MYSHAFGTQLAFSLAGRGPVKRWSVTGFRKRVVSSCEAHRSDTQHRSNPGKDVQDGLRARCQMHPFSRTPAPLPAAGPRNKHGRVGSTSDYLLSHTVVATLNRAQWLCPGLCPEKRQPPESHRALSLGPTLHHSSPSMGCVPRTALLLSRQLIRWKSLSVPRTCRPDGRLRRQGHRRAIGPGTRPATPSSVVRLPDGALVPRRPRHVEARRQPRHVEARRRPRRGGAGGKGGG